MKVWKSLKIMMFSVNLWLQKLNKNFRKLIYLWRKTEAYVRKIAHMVIIKKKRLLSKYDKSEWKMIPKNHDREQNTNRKKLASTVWNGLRRKQIYSKLSSQSMDALAGLLTSKNERNRNWVRQNWRQCCQVSLISRMPLLIRGSVVHNRVILK